MTKILVLAKAPIPGRVKTRLCPPCTTWDAAAIARAALRDTIDAVRDTAGAEPLLVLDGPPGPWLEPDIAVVPQRGRGLGERLAAAFTDAGTPALLIGMDTPQVTAGLLGSALDALHRPGVDAVLGPATDGGFWAVGFRRARHDAFDGVPMSVRHTGAVQLMRLRQLGFRVALLPELRDVDTIDDAIAVAAAAPDTRTARAVADVTLRLAASGRSERAAGLDG